MWTKTLGRKEPAQMMIIWGGFHPSWQQVSWLDTETGEAGAQKLVHAAGEAPGFYRHRYGGDGEQSVVRGDGCRIWGTRSGSGMRPRSRPATWANRRRT